MTREQWPDAVPDWIADPSDNLRTGNHLVPVTYLRRFTDDGTRGGRLWMYDRENPNEPVQLPPHAVAKKNDLYVWGEEVGLEPRDATERVLSYVEHSFSPAWQWLIYGPRVGLAPKPPPDLWMRFCDFVAFQHQRTPYWRDEYIGHGTFLSTVQLLAELEDLDRYQEKIEESSGERIPKEQLRDLRDRIRTGELEFGPGPSHWIGSFGQQAFKLARLIERLPMKVLRVPNGVELPTSDLPVAVFRITEDGYQPGGGFVQPGTEAVYPLSPKHVFVTGEAAEKDYVGTESWCAALQRRLVHHSRRFVFSRSRDPVTSEILRRTEPPRMVVEFEGKEYSLDGAIGPVAKEFLDSRPSMYRYGPQEKRSSE